MAVVGRGVEDASRKAFYRVVAVDEKGKRSGPSDYAAAPRPVIYSQPVVQARTGVEYRYDVRTIRSLGDFRTRVVNGKEVMNYWDVEQPRYLLSKDLVGSVLTSPPAGCRASRMLSDDSR